MSEQTNEVATTEPDIEVVGEVQEEKPDTTDWKAQARKWEARAKENREVAEQNKSAAAELEEIKRAQMSELEKAQALAAEATEKAQALEVERDRLTVIAKYQIPEEYAFLIGGDGLEDKAKTLQALLGETQKRVKWEPSGEKPLPRSLSDVTVEDQLRDAAQRGDTQASMRLKLLSLNSKQ